MKANDEIELYVDKKTKARIVPPNTHITEKGYEWITIHKGDDILEIYEEHLLESNPDYIVNGKRLKHDRAESVKVVSKPKKILAEPKSKKIQEEPKKKYTMKQLMDMTKGEQVKLLKELGVKNKEIPKYEKVRCKKILELI